MERSRSASTCTASSRTPRFLVLSGKRQEAGDTGETARRLAHLHERGRGADSIVDKASGGCSAAASRRRGRALLATSQRAQLAVAGREAAEEGGGRKKIRQRERGEGEK